MSKQEKLNILVSACKVIGDEFLSFEATLAYLETLAKNFPEMDFSPLIDLYKDDEEKEVNEPQEEEEVKAVKSPTEVIDELAREFLKGLEEPKEDPLSGREAKAYNHKEDKPYTGNGSAEAHFYDWMNSLIGDMEHRRKANEAINIYRIQNGGLY